MEPEEFELLYVHNRYCEMAHINRNGYPIVTPMFYVVIDGDVYISSIQKHRKKVNDLKDDEEARQAAFKGVHTPLRAIIKIVPNKTMSWDFGKMVQA